MGKRILVADDDPVLLDVLSVALIPDGYSVQTCTSAEAATVAVQTQHWDLILLDLIGRAPHEEAYGMVERICELAGGSPILLMPTSAIAAEWAQTKTRLAGVLPKPFGLEDLLRQVGEAVDLQPQAA